MGAVSKQNFIAQSSYIYAVAGKYRITVQVIDNDPAHPHDNPSQVTAAKVVRIRRAALDLTTGVIPSTSVPNTERSLYAGDS